MDNQLFQYVPHIYYGTASSDQYLLMLKQAQEQIRFGLQTVCASTGCPIELLWGGAHINAVLAAIGGGAISAGGYGVCGGIQVLIQYAWAAGAHYEAQRRLGTQWR